MNAVTYSHEMPIDRFQRKLTQAEALASTISGEGFETFSNMSDSLQDAAPVAEQGQDGAP